MPHMDGMGWVINSEATKNNSANGNTVLKQCMKLGVTCFLLKMIPMSVC